MPAAPVMTPGGFLSPSTPSAMPVQPQPKTKPNYEVSLFLCEKKSDLLDFENYTWYGGFVKYMKENKQLNGFIVLLQNIDSIIFRQNYVFSIIS